MTSADATIVQADTPEARRYNRIRRWLEMADLGLGFLLLVALLATGWTGLLRDLAYRGAHQIYSLAVFFYVGILLVLQASRHWLGLLRLSPQHRYHLSNRR